MILLISSYEPQPTSPTQISLEPGLKVKRKGLRSPYAMIRRSFGSAAPANGLSGMAEPVVGSTRMIDPSSVAGSPLVRRSWARRAPPSAVGGDKTAPEPPGGSPHGLSGLPS